MVIDSSALVAIVLDEPEREALAAAIAADATRLVSAATLLESSMVVESREGADAVDSLDQLLARIQADIVAVDERQARVARRAWREFGKGRHPAGLNFGDCFSYALAHAAGEPLLFKGDDFSSTDLAAVPY
jgi:ribonuclease VapC